MLKVGLIGCGGIGAVHAQCWLTMGDTVRLVAIADVSQERTQKFAEKTGEPDDISTWGVRDPEGIIQHIWSSFSYEGALMIAEGSWDYPTQLPFAAGFRVRFQEAALVLDEAGVLTVYPEEGEVFVPKLGARKIMDLGINVSDLVPYLNEIQYFVETIQSGNRRGISSLSEAVASFRLVQRELELIGGAKLERGKGGRDFE